MPAQEEVTSTHPAGRDIAEAERMDNSNKSDKYPLLIIEVQ